MATCEVWLPPARHSSARLPARETPERPWASPSRACSPWRRELLSESLPSWRCRPTRRTMKCTRETGRLQGLALATDPYCRRSLGDRPSLPSWGSPPQSHAHRPGTALWSRGLPSHPSRRADVPARQGPKVSRNRLARHIRLRMHQLSRGCSPHDGRGAPFAGAGDWRMAWPRSGCAAHAAVPLLFVPWRPAQPLVRTMGPAPPSVGDRLAPSTVRQCLSVKERPCGRALPRARPVPEPCPQRPPGPAGLARPCAATS